MMSLVLSIAQWGYKGREIADIMILGLYNHSGYHRGPSKIVAGEISAIEIAKTDCTLQ